MIDKTVEWEDYATDVEVEVMTRREAIEDLAPETPPERPYVLLLSSGGGGAFATSGTRDELAALIEKIRILVRDLPATPPAGWDTDPDDEEDADDVDA